MRLLDFLVKKSTGKVAKEWEEKSWAMQAEQRAGQAEKFLLDALRAISPNQRKRVFEKMTGLVEDKESLQTFFAILDEQDADPGDGFTPAADQEIAAAANKHGVHKELIKTIIAMECRGDWKNNREMVCVSGSGRRRCFYPYIGMEDKEVQKIFRDWLTPMPWPILDNDRSLQIEILAMKLANLRASTKREEIHRDIERYISDDDSSISALAKNIADKILREEK